MNRREFIQTLAVAGAMLPAGWSWASVPAGTLVFAEASKPGPRAMLETAGVLRGADYQVKWSEFNSTPLMLTALGAGAVDICSGGSTALVFLAANTPKLNFKAIFAQQLASPGRILVSQGSSLRHVADLRGKRIAVTRGTQLHYQVVQWLRQAGVGLDEVTLINLQPSESLTVLLRQDVDAWAVYEPYASVAEVNNGAVALAGTPALGDYGLVFASEATLADEGKVRQVRDFLGRLVKAQHWLNEHPEHWIETAAKVTGLPEAVARHSAPRTLALPVAITEEVIASVQLQADVFLEVGLIDHPVSLAGAFDKRFEDVLQ